MKILPEMWFWTGNMSPLIFQSYQDPDLGIFEGILPLWDRRNGKLSINFMTFFEGLAVSKTKNNSILVLTQITIRI